MMLKICLIALLFVDRVEHSVAQNSCIEKLSDIVEAERAVTDTTVKRTYTLCPGSKYAPGVVDGSSGVITVGDTPLVCRSNCTIQCGANGNPDNNCRIEATGTYGIFMIPSFVFGPEERDADNIVVKGVTVDSFKRIDQIPMMTASYTGSVTYEKCIFSNNSADPFIVVDRFVGSGRRALVDKEPKYREPRFLYPQNGDFESLNRPQSDLSEDEKAELVVDDEHERHLQQEGKFEVTFTRCTFDSNVAASPVRTQSGFSLIRFRNANPSISFDRLGSVDAKFIRNTFINNQLVNSNEDMEYRSLIDFFSSGTLTLDKNCFENSPVETHALITAQVDAKIVSSDNYVDAGSQASLSCGFLAFLASDYEFSACGQAATATTCQKNAFVFPCFPKDAYCQVEGRGDVPMAEIKLGDRVLVENGKYEPVYSFGHHSDAVEARFLKISTTNRSRSLEISEEHMVFMEAGHAIPASQVQVGDKLLLADSSIIVVKDIQIVEKRGVYAPFTPSGTVVVNGFLASTFLSFQNQANLHVGGIDTGVSYQFLSHSFEGPHRFWCKYMSDCSEEEYTSSSGIANRVDLPHKLARWFVAQNSVVMGFLTVPLLGMIFFLAFPVTSLALMVGTAIVIEGARRDQGLRITSRRLKQ